jgi:hypothetical protein
VVDHLPQKETLRVIRKNVLMIIGAGNRSVYREMVKKRDADGCKSNVRKGNEYFIGTNPKTRRLSDCDP